MSFAIISPFFSFFIKSRQVAHDNAQEWMQMVKKIPNSERASITADSSIEAEGKNELETLEPLFINFPREYFHTN